MTGSLQIKGNSYYAVLNTYNSEGKRKPKWVALQIPVKGNNKRKAKRELDMLLKKYDDFEKTEDYEDMFFEDFIMLWYQRKKISIEVSTWEGYGYHLQHVVDYFKGKKIKMSDLKSLHIKQYYDYQLRSGRKGRDVNGDTGLSARTVKSHSLLIKKALDEAVELHIIPENPAKSVSVPKKICNKQRHDDDMFMDETEILHFMEEIRGHQLYEVFLVILFFGLRRSEALGLKWGNIDFKNKQLYIRDTVVKVKTLQEKSRTKNKDSERVYPLTDEIIKLLENIKRQKFHFPVDVISEAVRSIFI